MPLTPDPSVLALLGQGQFPEQITSRYGGGPLFGPGGPFQYIGTPGGVQPFSSFSPQAQNVLSGINLNDFFNLVQGGAITPGALGQSGTGLAPTFNFPGGENLIPDAFVLNAVNSGLQSPSQQLDPNSMFDAFRRMNFFGPMEFPGLYQGGGAPNLSPPGSIPNDPRGGGNIPPGGKDGPGGGLVPPDPGAPPDWPFPGDPNPGGFNPFPFDDFFPDIFGGGGDEGTQSPGERIRALLRQFFPFFNPNPGSYTNPGTPPFNPDAPPPSDEPNPFGGDQPGFPGGFPFNPFDIFGRPDPTRVRPESSLDEAGRFAIKDVNVNVLNELLNALPGSLTQGDPLQQALLGTGLGMIPSPQLLQMGGIYPFGNNVFADALAGGGIGGQVQRLIDQNLVGNSFFGQFPGLSDPLFSNLGQETPFQTGAGPLLRDSQIALRHILNQGLPGQQRIQDQIYGNLGMAQDIMNNPNNFLTSLNQVFNQGLPGAPQIAGNLGAGQNIINQLFDPSLPAGANVAGPARFLNSIFRYGPPGQAADISGREGLEGLQGFLTNLGRDATERARDQFLGLQGNQPGIQGTAEEALGGLISGGGLSPEFVQAMQNRVLEPSEDRLVNRLNELSGGYANLGTSGVTGEALSDLYSNFNDDLVRRGFENLNQSIGQGIGLGGQQFGQEFGIGQALAGLGQSGFGAAPGISSTIMQNALAPIGSFGNLTSQLQNQGLNALNSLAGNTFGAIGLGSDVFNQLQNQALNQFGSVAQNVFPYLQQSSNLGMGLANFGLGAAGQLQNLAFQPQLLQDQRMQQGFGNLMQMLGGAQGILGQQQGFGSEVARLGLNPLLALMNYDAQRQLANQGGGNINDIIGIIAALGGSL